MEAEPRRLCTSLATGRAGQGGEPLPQKGPRSEGREFRIGRLGRIQILIADIGSQHPFPAVAVFEEIRDLRNYRRSSCFLASLWSDLSYQSGFVEVDQGFSGLSVARYPFSSHRQVDECLANRYCLRASVRSIAFRPRPAMSAMSHVLKAQTTISRKGAALNRARISLAAGPRNTSSVTDKRSFSVSFCPAFIRFPLALACYANKSPRPSPGQSSERADARIPIPARPFSRCSAASYLPTTETASWRKRLTALLNIIS